jgi:SAM-dependent methyltransferase
MAHIRASSTRPDDEATPSTDIVDKAGQSYWDQVWEGLPIPAAIDPHDPSRHNHIQRRFHQYFARAFAGQETVGKQLLEVGAGGSRWLPYFANEFGFAVAGIDYSPQGCEQGEAILRQAGVEGKVLLADLFAPPPEMLGVYDVVVSIGLVEHFDNTAACVASLARFLQPRGLMITVIPNLVGGIGWLQRHVCRSIYDVHVPLDRESLRAAHERAGLAVAHCDYFLAADLSAVNLACWSDRWFYRSLLRLPYAVAQLQWLLDERGVKLPSRRQSSRYVICSARK